MFNQITILGRLVSDPTITYVKSAMICNFSLYTYRYNSDGTRACDIFKVVAFGDLASFAADYLRKNRYVFCVGRMQFQSVIDRNGHPYFLPEVKAAVIEPFDNRRSNNAPARFSGGSNSYKHQASPMTYEDAKHSLDDWEDDYDTDDCSEINDNDIFTEEENYNG